MSIMDNLGSDLWWKTSHYFLANSAQCVCIAKLCWIYYSGKGIATKLKIKQLRIFLGSHVVGDNGSDWKILD